MSEEKIIAQIRIWERVGPENVDLVLKSKIFESTDTLEDVIKWGQKQYDSYEPYEGDINITIMKDSK